MKLLTKEIEKKIPALYQTDGMPKEERVVACKFFNPRGDGTWYALEGEREGDDFRFFGYVVFSGCKEYGYFMLSELEENGIERDLYFGDSVTLDKVA